MLLFSPKSRVNNIQNVKYAKLGSSHRQSVSFRINGRCYVSCAPLLTQRLLTRMQQVKAFLWSVPWKANSS